MDTDACDEEGLFELKVTRRWLRQVILALTLICRSSYRGVIEFMRDLLGVHISEGTVHNVQAAAAEQAVVINGDIDLSLIEVGLHDEIFQGGQPVLTGVDAASTYCYMLEAVKQRDAHTWGVNLLDVSAQGLELKFSVGDAGAGLRAGQKLAWPDTPCHGDVFHIEHQVEGLANTLARIAQGHTSRCKKLQTRIDQGHQRDEQPDLAEKLSSARQAQARAQALASDVRTLATWLGHDVLSLAGPTLLIRQELYDFIVVELKRREHDNEQRIRAVRVALENQRDDLLAFAGVLDDELSAIAQTHDLPDSLVREVLVLHRLPSTSQSFWQGWGRLRAPLGPKFQAVFDAVQFSGGKRQLAAAHVLHAASPSRRLLPGLAAVLPQSPALHAQPGRPQRQKPARIDDGARASPLAHAAGLGSASASARLTRREAFSPRPQHTVPYQYPASVSGRNALDFVTQKRMFLNHAKGTGHHLHITGCLRLGE